MGMYGGIARIAILRIARIVRLRISSTAAPVLSVLMYGRSAPNATGLAVSTAPLPT